MKKSPPSPRYVRTVVYQVGNKKRAAPSVDASNGESASACEAVDRMYEDIQAYTEKMKRVEVGEKVEEIGEHPA